MEIRVDDVLKMEIRKEAEEQERDVEVSRKAKR